MGYPYHELIPPAILLQNPGITKENFVELLNNTHSSNIFEAKHNDPWSEIGLYENDEYHAGLHGLGQILKVGYTEKFKELHSQRLDKNGLFWQHPFFTQEIIYQKGIFSINYNVKEYSETELFEPETGNYSCWDKMDVGSLYEDLYGFSRALVLEIYNQNDDPIDTNEEDEDFGERKIYEYNMKLRFISRDEKEHKFDSLEKLVEKFPQFNPMDMYDFSKKEGNFMMLPQTYSWKQTNGKYYLDEKTFDKISSGKGAYTYGYTDLIITSEAIKNKAWKMLTNRGLDHYNAFLTDFPESRKVIEKAIWDSHTSLYAKHNKISTSDLLRIRITGMI